jgi:hypothetical protein
MSIFSITEVIPGSLCWYDSGTPTQPDWQLGRLSGWVAYPQWPTAFGVVVKDDGSVADYPTTHIKFCDKKPKNEVQVP